MKLIYYPGCTLKNHARNFDVSTVSSMAELDVEVEELARWNCCGTVHALASDDLMHRMAPVTNLIRVKEAQASEFMTSCAMCYNTLKRANIDVKKRADAL
ncbi:MAG: heterodisulfide reductase subunit, partial [Pseudomonadota bacterium]|nr:heterodisulfide reductase subunit [Pseudomonadota bacterium]